MVLSRLSKRISGWFSRPWTQTQSAETAHREALTHVIILDGTMSSLEPGYETNAGLTYRLCREMGPRVSVYYEAGVQWQSWRSMRDVSMGRGINRQIRRAYGYLASRYRPGDRIFLLGYSRGAFAVRSLAGVIDRVGLLRPDCATERNIRSAYRHYECTPDSPAAQAFARIHCHMHTPIEMIGVWDTVKALGLRLPFLWHLTEPSHAFHNHRLGACVKHGFHALALDETRAVFAPVMWSTRSDWPGHLEQVWFRGTHGDVGGQLGGFEAARPLANIPLVWMLRRAEASGLPLPTGWERRFHLDAGAPSVGSWRHWGKLFLSRQSRRVGDDASERLHHSVPRPSEPDGVARRQSLS